jgi:hypothetical protein
MSRRPELPWLYGRAASFLQTFERLELPRRFLPGHGALLLPLYFCWFFYAAF